MKKIVYLILLIIPFILTNKVNAEEKTLYSYNISVIVDDENGTVNVEESFETHEIDNSIKYKMDLDRYNIEKTNIENIKEFNLESNKNYYIKYSYKCSLESCSFSPNAIYYESDGVKSIKYDSLTVSISNRNETAFPSYYITNSNSYSIRDENGTIIANLNGKNIEGLHIETERNVEEFTEKELEELDEKAEGFFVIIALIVDFFILVAIVVFNSEKNRLNGIVKYNERCDDLKRDLYYWVTCEVDKRENKALKIIFIIAILLAFIPVTVTIAVYAKDYGGIVNITSVPFFYFIGLIHTGMLSIWLYITVIKTIENNLLVKLIDYKLYEVTDYKVVKMVSDKKIKYKIIGYIYINDIKVELQGKMKTRKNNIEDDNEVFALFKDEKHYYIDFKH